MEASDSGVARFHRPRLLIIDPNIADAKGHFLELAIVIADSASKIGYRCQIATSKVFRERDISPINHKVTPVFSSKKIRRWSLGPHGYSRVARDLSGHPVGGNVAVRAVQWFIDSFHGQPPQAIVSSMKQEISSLIEDFNPCENDHVLFSTGDDFVLLVATAALRPRAESGRFGLSFLWHNPVVPGRLCELRRKTSREIETSRQVKFCLQELGQLKPRFLATTHELAIQFEACLGVATWEPLAYPIRSSFRLQCGSENEHAKARELTVSPQHDAKELARTAQRPIQLTCGGAQRSEKGAKTLGRLTALLWGGFLSCGKAQLGLQVDQNAVLRLKQTAHRLGDKSSGEFPFNFAKPSLSSAEYLHRIRSADIGLFLYDSRRYYTRCSGVLIEMLSCGKPVIVPAGCWLSRQIARENFRYAESLEQRFCQKSIGVLCNAKLGTFRQQAVKIEIRFSGTSAAMSLAFRNATQHSYVAIEASSRDRSGKFLSCLYVLEVLNNKAKIVLAPLPGAADPTRMCLRVWSPYGEKGLVVDNAVCSDLVCPDMATASIGHAFSRMSDMPIFVGEMIEKFDCYRNNALEFRTSFAKQHSGSAFVAELLRNEVICGP